LGDLWDLVDQSSYWDLRRHGALTQDCDRVGTTAVLAESLRSFGGLFAKHPGVSEIRWYLTWFNLLVAPGHRV
jgi:hypothetical protein